MKWTKKRTLLTVLLLLTGGAIINVAVAWGCTLWVRGQSVPLSSLEVTQLLQREFAEKSDISPEFPDGARVGGFGFHRQIAVASFVLRNHDREARDCVVFSAGFPTESLDGRRLHRGMSEILRNAWKSPRFVAERMRASPPAFLPLRPLWPGFAINTIFYAAVLWLLVAIPGFVRRRIRARRGQCPACAYPVGASDVCTECGKRLPKRAGV